jgi:hypothetical protein
MKTGSPATIKNVSCLPTGKKISFLMPFESLWQVGIASICISLLVVANAMMTSQAQQGYGCSARQACYNAYRFHIIRFAIFLKNKKNRRMTFLCQIGTMPTQAADIACIWGRRRCEGRILCNPDGVEQYCPIPALLSK